MTTLRVRAGIVVLAVAIGTVALVAAGGGTAAADQTTVTVSVVDQSGNPLDDAQVNVSWDGGSNEGVTKNNGEVLLDVPEGADVTVTVERSYYVRNTPLEIEDFDGSDVEVDMARKGDATLVVEDEDGPVADAAVRLFRDGQPFVQNRTDENGEFATGPIEYDDYTLVAFNEGYVRNDTTVEVDGSVEESIEIQEDARLVTLQVNDDHFDPPEPIENATITINGETVTDETVSTRGNGQIRVDLPVNDEYTVGISKDGYGSVTRTVEVDEESTSLEADIQRIPAISVESAQSRVVVGEQVRVTVTGEYGAPVEGASVTIDGETVGATDSQGQTDVPVDAAGEHTIAATADDLEAETTIEGVGSAEGTPTATDTSAPTATDTPADTPTATDTTTPTEEPTTDGSGPGFGVLGALASVAAIAVVAFRRP